MTQLIEPCIWLRHDAEDAIRFYTELVPDSTIHSLNSTTDPIGNYTVFGSFRLGGVNYRVIGGPAEFTLNPSFSISIECADQAEVDRYWNALVDGGEPSQCGWLTDRWGLSWQIVPAQLGALLSDPDPARANAALQAMFGMSKLIIADLEAAVAAV